MAKAFSFFGAVDRDYKGKVCSEFPAWMLPIHREKLSEEIDSMKRRLRSGEVDEYDARTSLKEEIDKNEVRLQEIDASRPMISAAMKDKISKHYAELSKSISASMFTRYEENHNFADAHEEMNRMLKPCIAVDEKLAKAANLKLDKDGKVSRNDATKLWKILGHVLGLATNVERLRKQQ